MDKSNDDIDGMFKKARERNREKHKVKPHGAKRKKLLRTITFNTKHKYDDSIFED